MIVRLLHKPAWQPGESWPGFLMRIAAANEFPGMSRVASLLGMTTIELICRQPRETLMRLGYSSTLDFPRVTVKDGADFKLFRAGAHGRSMLGRVCAACLRSDATPFSRARWDFALEFTCHVHGTELTDSCPSCAVPLDHERPRLASCRCGYDLRHAPLVKADLQGVLDVFGIDSTRTIGDDTFAATTDLELLAVRALLRILAWHADAPKRHPHRHRIRAAKNAFVSIEAMRVLEPWFRNWPNGFLECLQNTRKQCSQKSGPALNASTLEARFFPKVGDALAELDRRTRQSPRPGSIRADPNRILMKSKVGVRDIILLTHCSYDTAIRWINSGKLGEVEMAPISRTKLVPRVDAHRVAELVDFYKSTMSVREAASVSGFDRCVIRGLVRAEILKGHSILGADFTARVTATELFEFMANLRKRASIARPTSDTIVSLATACSRITGRYGTRGIQRLHRFMKAIAAQMLRIFVHLKASVLSTEIYLRHDDLAKWLASDRGRSS